MNVSACLVTRGDVDMQLVIDSLPREWEIVIWDNSGVITRSDGWAEVCADVSVYGRYAAIEFTTHDLIYVQDDDVIVSDPQEIVDALLNRPSKGGMGSDGYMPGYDEVVVCNMPLEFRPHYDDAALVGFGAAFHRDVPARAWRRLGQWRLAEIEAGRLTARTAEEVEADRALMERECDRVFTVLTPKVLVDVPKTNREFADAPDRLYRQPGHHASTRRMIELARRVRDA